MSTMDSGIFKMKLVDIISEVLEQQGILICSKCKLIYKATNFRMEAHNRQYHPSVYGHYSLEMYIKQRLR